MSSISLFVIKIVDVIHERTVTSTCLVYPIDDIHQLRLSFPLPSLDEYWRIKPIDYIRFIFAHEAPGSLNSYLKTKYEFDLIIDNIRHMNMFVCSSEDCGYHISILM
jgi:secreted Zn-dependent insulinase-like peptidase